LFFFLCAFARENGKGSEERRKKRIEERSTHRKVDKRQDKGRAKIGDEEWSGDERKYKKREEGREDSGDTLQHSTIFWIMYS
jgi:hypothetical protein